MKHRLALLALALTLGCRTEPPAPPPTRAPLPLAAPVAAPTPVAPPAALPQEPAAEPNRDAHGSRDVSAYVRSLESEKRVATLQPDVVIEQLALAPDAVIADLGCGPGVFALRFARASPQGVVYAVDIEPRQLDRLREHLLAENIENVVPVLCSASTSHLPPHRCDLVFIGDTYHHFENRVEYMARLKSVLAPGGRLAIFEYKPGPLPVGPPPDHKLKAGELAQELTAAGYELEREFVGHEYHDFQVWKPLR